MNRPAESIPPRDGELQHFEERPFFFDTAWVSRHLFGILYQPDRPTGLGMLFLHPIGAERNTCDTVPVNIARSLAARGIVCLRFDYTGTGDSAGDFRDMTKDTLFADLEAALAILRSVEGVRSVGLFGLRFGGMLAALYAEKPDSGIDHLVLCAPVVDFADYINKGLMMSITSQSVMFGRIVADREMILRNLESGAATVHEGFNLSNIDGFPLADELWLAFKGHNLLHDTGAFTGRCLLINLCIPGKRKDQAVAELTRCYQENSSYEELPVRYLPWILNNLLVTSLPGLNDCVTAWLCEGGA